jgi:anti-sigma factor RsiW
MLPGERDIAGLTCSQVLANLSAYVYRELPPGHVARIEAHVSACPACATFGAQFVHLLDEVRARMKTPEPLPADVAARLGATLARTF